MEDSLITDFKRELAALATIRDELKLKAQLARADVKSELDQLERRWQLADEHLQRAKLHVKQDVASVQGELKTLLADLKRGYQDAKQAFDAD